MDDSPRPNQRQDWMAKRPHILLYLSTILSAWGDRMWSFSVGLYLVYFTNGLLRLAAIYGFSAGCAILIFGGIIGNWVDRNPRLKVVRITLFCQNLLVTLCAGTVFAYLSFRDSIDTKWGDNVRRTFEAAIVIVAILAQLASVGHKVAISKDWIVVISGGDKEKLARLNAVTRGIDLCCKILAPILAGLIMSHGSLKIAAIVISGWNLVSVFFEYALLHKIFSLYPKLATKCNEDTADENIQETENQTLATSVDGQQLPEQSNPLLENKSGEQKSTVNPVKSLNAGDKQDEEAMELATVEKHNKKSGGLEPETSVTTAIVPSSKSGPKPKAKSEEKHNVAFVMCEAFIILGKGWKVYAKQRAVFAGVALACLYVTVLGFDSITTGYLFAQGIPEYIVGICMGLGGLTGLFGTFFFTWSRKQIGLERTGLFGFGMEIICISLCVFSVWTPGSPFVYSGLPPKWRPQNCNNSTNDTVPSHFENITMLPGNTSNAARIKRDATINAFMDSDYSMGGFLTYDSLNTEKYKLRFTDIQSPSVRNMDLEMGVLVNSNRHKRTVSSYSEDKQNEKDTDEACVQKFIPYSAILFLTGLVTSRVGLWTADLVVTQTLQESVPQMQRGIVGGVQQSLNMLMDMLKFTCVIFVPRIETFGFLIFGSFIAICFGGCLFAVHSFRERGHLFHFERYQCKCGEISDSSVQQNPITKHV